MIYTTGDILKSKDEAIVIPVNCVGTMGKGLALQSKHKFPDNYTLYRKACASGGVGPGKVFITTWTTPPHWIVNFPTKLHWKNPSRIEWIEDGLNILSSYIQRNQIFSISVPPLGCGLGGLKWTDVKPLIEKILNIPNLTVTIYENAHPKVQPGQV